ncbi:MAG: hypothetical protein VW405_10730 [Rhodospirillaceae bacterium]
MFNLKSHDRSPTWYPGARAIRDRWGTPIGPKLGGSEFRAAPDAADGRTDRLRWSLGLV